jgi:hypothetical protein
MPGWSFAEQMSLQLDNAQKIFKQFNFVKMDKWQGDDAFGETIEVVFTFVSASGQRVWQVTWHPALPVRILSILPAYIRIKSMENEIGRLQRCVKRFILNT